MWNSSQDNNLPTNQTVKTKIMGILAQPSTLLETNRIHRPNNLVPNQSIYGIVRIEEILEVD